MACSIAGLAAGVAALCLATLVVLGPRIGWVLDAGGDADVYNVRGELPWMAVLLASVLVGAVLAAKRPRNPIPWLLIATGLGFMATSAVSVTVAYALVRNGEEAWIPYVAWLGNWVWLLGISGTLFLLLLFPDGQPLNDHWRTFLHAVAGYLGLVFLITAFSPQLYYASHLDNPLGITWFQHLWPVIDLTTPVFLALPVCVGVALVLRFVRSSGIERHQMKWMAYGAAVFGVTTAIALPLGAPRWVLAIAQAALVAAIVAAITRYRLYDVDRLISRTVSYGMVTVVLAAIYVVGVFGVGTVARGATGRDGGDVVVAASTLAVAAAFGPVRRRIQDTIDRRFNRSRYDAVRTVEALGQRLRDEVHVDALVEQIRWTAEATLQPRVVSVWLRHQPPQLR